MDELLEASRPFLPYIPLILTIVGWSVANSTAGNREVRKERRSEVDACCKLAADLLAKVRAYYTKGADHEDSSRLGREVVFDLHRLLQRVERLGKNCPKFEVVGVLGELYEAITGGEFDSSTRKALQHDAPEILNIEYWTHALMNGMEDGFADTFRS